LERVVSPIDSDDTGHKNEQRRLKVGSWAGHWKLMPIILATQKAEIKRITVQSQSQANNLWDSILKKITKRAGGVAQGVGPEFKPQYCQKKKKERKWKESGSLNSWHISPSAFGVLKTEDTLQKSDLFLCTFNFQTLIILAKSMFANNQWCFQDSKHFQY
jgi:hypothetical protein